VSSDIRLKNHHGIAYRWGSSHYVEMSRVGFRHHLLLSTGHHGRCPPNLVAARDGRAILFCLQRLDLAPQIQLATLNLRPARFWAEGYGLAELLGGVGLTLGLFTPIAAALIIGVMLTAIIKVHWPHGLWVTRNGFEYPLVIILVAAFLGLAGPAVTHWTSGLTSVTPRSRCSW